jgi:hypothetical protein
MEDVLSHRQACRPRPWNQAIQLFVAFVGIAVPAAAQTASVPVNTLPGHPFLCDSKQFLIATPLTFRQRACWYGSALASPWGAIGAGLSSGMGQWLNLPSLKHQDADDYGHRLALHYVRRSARETSELMAGYLNHEDPRPHPSGQTAVKRRIGIALLSVLVTTSDKGRRPALGPIAGSLGSGFAGAMFDRQHTSASYAARGAGIAYAGYFGRALYQEFRPDISFFARRILHKAL